MATKKKPGQSDKTYPRPKQTWEDSSDEKDIFDILILTRDLDETKKEFWNCKAFHGDDQNGVDVKLYLKDFTKPGVQCIADPDAPAAEPPASMPKLEPSIIFSKRGAHMTCPAQGCEHILPLENTCTKTELLALFDSFEDLHRPHYYRGTIWDPNNKA